MNENQVTYANNGESESGRLISDVLEITNSLDIEVLLMALDIEKAFDSINHKKWIQILIKNSESCVITGGKTALYFKLERGTRQGDPIPAYLFILSLEVISL